MMGGHRMVGMMTLCFWIWLVDVILSVPRFSEVDEIQPDRKLHVWVADLDVEANVSSAFKVGSDFIFFSHGSFLTWSFYAQKKETSIKISVLDALLEDLSNPSKATTMFARTINRSLVRFSFFLECFESLMLSIWSARCSNLPFVSNRINFPSRFCSFE